MALTCELCGSTDFVKDNYLLFSFKFFGNTCKFMNRVHFTFYVNYLSLPFQHGNDTSKIHVDPLQNITYYEHK